MLRRICMFATRDRKPAAARCIFSALEVEGRFEVLAVVVVNIV